MDAAVLSNGKALHCIACEIAACTGLNGCCIYHPALISCRGGDEKGGEMP
jgi:L-cystine uptake protein TcyP (sodium:dicarboxylate symporter family)